MIDLPTWSISIFSDEKNWSFISPPKARRSPASWGLEAMDLTTFFQQFSRLRTGLEAWKLCWKLWCWQQQLAASHQFSAQKFGPRHISKFSVVQLWHSCAKKETQQGSVAKRGNHGKSEISIFSQIVRIRCDSKWFEMMNGCLLSNVAV